MKKNILFLATVPSMIVAFNMRNIKMLQDMGYTIHAACNYYENSAWTDEQLEEYRSILRENSVVMHQIDFPRKPYHPISLIKSYFQTKRLLKKIDFEMLHNQSCVSGILGRIACRKYDMKVIHTEHGFYYFKGGPLFNWIFYPFDRLCSYFTDAIVTINKDDTAFAKKHMRAKKVVYIPGVGIDVDYYQNTVIDKEAMKEKIGLPKNSFVVLSVGELNENKNHSAILRAISKIDSQDIYYVICGEGTEKENLVKLAKELGMEKRLFLMGQRKNVNEFYKMADVFAFPSKREGLGLAALEAMASRLPLVTSNKNGINDYAENELTGYMCSPEDIDRFSEAILKLYKNTELRETFGAYNIEKVKGFSQKKTDEIMLKLYKDTLRD